MSTLGIVLAAGESSRFPNKLFLPSFTETDGCRIVVQSSLRHLCRLGCEDIVVVEGPNRLVGNVLRLFHENVSAVIQPKPLGVVDAIQKACTICLNSRECKVIITFGDNIYAEDDMIVLSQSYATIRRIPPKNNHDLMWNSLDIYEGDRVNPWEPRRPVNGRNGRFRLAGWLQFVPEDIQRLVTFDPSMTLCEMLNILNVKGIESEAKWYDLGTPDAYDAYVKEKQRENDSRM